MRRQTELTYRDRINRVIVHIESHLAEPIDSEQLAEVALMSRYHFQRMFVAMQGESPLEYLQRRRLHTAVDKLLASEASVTAIALDCGFESVHALGKALRRSTGLSATALRRAMAQGRPHPFRTFPPIHSSKGKTMLQPEFREFPTRPLLIATEYGMINNNAGVAARKAFARLEDAVAANEHWRPLVCGCLDFCGRAPIGPNDPDLPFHAALVLREAITLPEGSDLGFHYFEGGPAAVFLHRGPYDTLWQTWQAIYRDWVPNCGLELRHTADWEEYLNSPHEVAPEALLTEICVPLKKLP
ncbi:AraC family transcriptional regulator [Chitinimonas sp.]|uniref:AraC family transcriptional regulator n=1 Tax=Chitinimonas sp. TaxID=1934313 RepID=UPI002F920D25